MKKNATKKSTTARSTAPRKRMTANTIAPESCSNLAKQAYGRIKEDIIRCRLAPDILVSARQLTQDYGFGLSPIRSAMDRLVAKQWAEALPKRGYRILPITIQDVFALYDVAEQVSPKLARLSAGRIGDRYDELRRLNAICNTATPPADRESEERIIEAGGTILREIRRASGNRYAIAITQHLAESVERVLEARRQVASRPIDMRRDFGPLLDALRNNDPDTAERESLNMVRGARAIVQREILSSPDVAGQTIHLTPTRDRTLRHGRAKK